MKKRFLSSFVVLSLIIPSVLAAQTATLSGVIRHNGNSLSGVSVTLTGLASTIGTVITGGDGRYSFTVSTFPLQGSYTVTPSKSGYSFDPVSWLFVNVSSSQTKDFAAALNTCNISGSVKLADSALAGVKVRLSGTSSDSTTTDSNGNYSLSVGATGTYTVTPEKAGYTFEPVSALFPGILTSVTQNFTATRITYTISGRVTLSGGYLSGVLISWAGSSAGSTTTNDTGYYAFPAGYGGNYVITPSKSGFSFDPSSTTVQNVAGNQTANFTASNQAYTITGTIIKRDSSGSQVVETPMDSVQVILTGSENDTAMTDASGKYSFTVLKGGTFLMVPFKANFVFNPLEFRIPPIQANIVQNFVGSSRQITLSGYVRLKQQPFPNVTVLVTGSRIDSTKSDADGRYAFTVLAGGTYLVSPFKSYYVFSPVSKQFDKPAANDTASFSTEGIAPILLDPPHDGKDVSINAKLLWLYVGPRPATFHVQIAKDTAFSQMALDTTGVTDSLFYAIGLPQATILYWRVRAAYQTELSEWSMVRKFKTMSIAYGLVISETGGDPLGDRTPLLLIHGWNFTQSPAPPSPGWWLPFRSYFVGERALTDSFKVYSVNYYANLFTVPVLARMLREYIEKMDSSDQNFAQKPLTILAHSMGGVISRSFMSEQTFLAGPFAGKLCGERVGRLITLGTPHHGSPMANGPARDAKVSLANALLIRALESTMFSSVPYNLPNRTDLHWDNVDNLLDYGRFAGERNGWLESLNRAARFNEKTIAYAGSIPGTLLYPPYDDKSQYDVAAYILHTDFGLASDGIVPLSSASLAGDSVKKIVVQHGYDHAEIAKGKGGEDLLLFGKIKADLLGIERITLMTLTGGEVLKESRMVDIEWIAPTDMERVHISYSADSGATYTRIVSDLNAFAGAYQWRVPQLNSRKCFIKISNAADTSKFTRSDSTFRIYWNWVQVLWPDGSKSYEPKDTVQIRWKRDGIETASLLLKYESNDPAAAPYQYFVIKDSLSAVSQPLCIWTVPDRTVGTDSGRIAISYRPDDAAISQSKRFKMWPPRKLTLLYPNGNEQLEYGTYPEFKWKSEGNIKEVTLHIGTTEKWDLIKSNIADSGRFNQWQVEKYSKNKFWAKIADAERTSHREVGGRQFPPVADTSDKGFWCKMAAPLLKDPPNTTSLGAAVRVNPQLKWDPNFSWWIDPSRVNKREDILQLSDDSGFGRIIINKTIVDDSSYQSPELEMRTIHYWRVMTTFTYDQNKTAESYTSKVFSFRTEYIPPQTAPNLYAPPNGHKIPQKETFVWSKVLRAKRYRLQISKQSDFSILEKNLSVAKDTSVVVDLDHDAVEHHWRVRAENDAGSGPYSEKRTFQLLEKSQRWSNFTLAAARWERFSDSTYKGYSPLVISPLDDSKYSINISGGTIVVDTGKARVYEGSGDVSFKTTEGSVSLFRGSFALTDQGLTPAGATTVMTKSSELGQMPVENLSIKGVFTASPWRLEVSYPNSSVVIDVPGVRMSNGKLVEFVHSGHIKILGTGSFEGGAADITLDFASIYFNLRKIRIEGSVSGRAMFRAEEVYINMVRNFAPGTTDIELPRDIVIAADHTMKFDPDDPQLFPNIKLLDYQFDAPALKFTYEDDIKAYVLSGNASLVLPFQAKKNAAGKWSSGMGACVLSTTVKLRSTSPYLYYASVLADGCWAVPLAPGAWFTGAGGSLKLGADNNGTINWVEVGGQGIFTFGLQTPPLVKTYAKFNLDTRGRFSLDGEAKLLGFITFANAGFWFDASNPDRVVVGARGHLESPPWKPIFITDVEGGFQFGKPSGGGSINPVQRMYLKGSSVVQVPAKLISFWGINLPRNPIVLRGYSVEVGEFRDGGRSKGFGVQSRVLLAKLWYWCGPWPWDWCSYDLRVDVFVSLQNGHLAIGRDLYDLVTFDRKLALRRKGDLSKVRNVTAFFHSMQADTINFDVPESTSEDLLVGLRHFSATVPELTLVAPNNNVYDSKSYLKRNPEAATDSGYIMYAPRVKGGWRAIVKNADPRSNYEFHVGGKNVGPTLKLDGIQKSGDQVYTIAYTVQDPDDRAVVNFYYAESDTAFGTTLNTEEIIAKNGSGEYRWQTKRVKNGSYHIYGMVNDGKHSFVRADYNGVITIANTTRPAPPHDLVALSKDSLLYLNWTDPDSTHNYYVLLGSRSHVYEDTIRIANSRTFVLKPDSDSTLYYASVYSVDINQHRSDLSPEISFRLSSTNQDGTPPPQPSIAQTRVTLPDVGGDSARVSPLVSVRWTKVPDAEGYELAYASRKDNSRFTFDVGDADSVDLQGLTQGESYLLSLRSYDRARNYSLYSDEVQVDVYDQQDVDGDGMVDAKELRYFGSISATNEVTRDDDGDGLTNGEELSSGTNPNSVDTDGDWIWDDVDKHPALSLDEIANGIADDWEDYYEVYTPSDDPDGDGLSNLTEFQFGSDPKNVDTDGGGKSDKDEYALKLNPRDPKDDKSDIRGFVKIESFTMKTLPDSVVLTWRSKDERELAGFHLYRKSARETFSTRLNGSIIPRIKDSLTSHTYHHVDRNVESGLGYQYHLEGEGLYGNFDSLAVVSSITTVEAEQSETPREFSLSQNYPNPFNPSTKIPFSVPEDAEVTLIVYDMLGRQVAQLVNERMKPGYYSATWNANGIASGVYIVRMNASGFSKTKAMVLVR